MPLRRPRKQARAGQTAVAGKGLIPDSDDASPIGSDKVTAVYLSPDHRHLAVVTGAVRLALYRLNGAKLGEKLSEHLITQFPRIVWSHGGAKLAFVNSNGRAEILDVPSGKSRTLGSAVSVAFHPDGSLLAAMDKEKLTIWQVDPLRSLRKASLQAGAPTNLIHTDRPALGISPDGRWLARGTETCAVQVIEMEDMRVVNEFTGLGCAGPARGAAVGPGRAARVPHRASAAPQRRLAEVVAEFGFRRYLPTSAKEDWGVGELRAAILDAIDWDRMPVVTSSALFAAAKSFVLDQKEAGTLLSPLASLLAAFLPAPVTGPAAETAPDAKTGRDLLDAEPGAGDKARLRTLFEGCVTRLESAGLVKRLAFGDLVLLQPELIDVYAGAIVNAARDEPDGLGSILESRVLEVDFRLPEHERIADRQQEKLLIIATLEELTRHEIVLREETEDGVQLVFPAAFRRDLPETAEPADNTVEFTFEGPVVNIYVTLVVRLARSNRFSRRGAFQSVAQFEADSGGVCTVHLTRSDEGRGTLQAGYSGDVAEVVRFQFERFVLAHLERRATSGTVRLVRLYRCPECGTPFTTAQTEAALSRGRTSLLCPADETRVPLDDSFAGYSQGQDAVTEQMDASADAARSLAAASSIILGKEETTDFDVFLCHHSTDKPAVRQTAQRLREHGVLPWLDEAELIPGRPWQEELERQISHIRAAAVFVGPNGVGPWQNQEMRAFLSEFIDRQCPVIPVLLPGAAAPELPIFLRRMTWVDLGKANGIERLIWGITGRRQVPSEPGQVLQ